MLVVGYHDAFVEKQTANYNYDIDNNESTLRASTQPFKAYSIILNLIVFFLLSSFGIDFVLHANEDSQLHGRRATSKNEQTTTTTMTHDVLQALPQPEVTIHTIVGSTRDR